MLVAIPNKMGMNQIRLFHEQERLNLSSSLHVCTSLSSQHDRVLFYLSAEFGHEIGEKKQDNQN